MDSPLKRLAMAATLALVTAGLVALPVTQAHASVQQTFYVSPSGSGSACSTGTPCALSTAQSLVRAAAPTMSGDLVVYLKAGTYPAGIELTDDDSGTGGHQVVLQADPAATGPVLVSGGVPISGWSLHDSAENIFVANVPSSFDARQIWVNGVRASVAAKRAVDVFGTMTKTATGYTYTATGPNSWSGTDRVVLAYNSGWPWTYTMCPTTSIQSGAITVAQPCHNASGPNSFGNKVGLPSEVQNHYSLLTEPGQFYVDATADKIYYIPRPAETMSTATVIGAQLDQPSTQVPRTENPTLLSGQGVRNVTIRGITFSYGTWAMDRTGYVDAQGNALDQCGGAGTTTSCMADEQTPPDGYLRGQRLLPAAVDCHACENVTFERNVFSRLGGSGLTLDEGGVANSVVGNVFRDISGNGINLSTGYADTPNWDPPAYEDQTTVSNNYLFDIANEYLGGVGIFASWVKNTTISHNEIAAVSYSGISLGWGAGAHGTPQMTNNHIDDNYVHDVVTAHVHDGGAIYLNGTQLDHANGNTVSRNHVQNLGGRYSSLYFDDGATNWDAAQNVVDAYSPSWMLSKSGSNTFSNNYVSSKAGAAWWQQSGTFSGNVTGLTTWPVAAQEIMATAGIEPEFADVLPGASEINLAYRGATRSSGDNGGYTSDRAVDGWNGEASDPGGWITGGTAPHRWQVDLGASNTLSKIEVLFRQDDADHPDQRKNFQILVSNSDIFDNATSATIACERTGSPLPHKARYDCVPPAGAWRYVAVVKTDDVGFVLGEVRVYGHATAAPFSYHGTGTSWTKYEGAASRIAVDNAGSPWIVDGGRNLQRWTGDGWGTVRNADVLDVAVGGDSAGTIAIIQSGTNRVLKSADNGQTWTDISGPTPAVLASKVAVDQSGGVWAVDPGGILRKFDGSTWTQKSTSIDDVGLYGSTVAVSAIPANGNELYTYNGTGWTWASGQGVSVAGDNAGWLSTTTTSGAVYKGKAPFGASGGWSLIRPAGSATDVGVSPTTGAIWILSK